MGALCDGFIARSFPGCWWRANATPCLHGVQRGARLEVGIARHERRLGLLGGLRRRHAGRDAGLVAASARAGPVVGASGLRPARDPFALVEELDDRRPDPEVVVVVAIGAPGREVEVVVDGLLEAGRLARRPAAPHEPLPVGLGERRELADPRRLPRGAPLALLA